MNLEALTECEGEDRWHKVISIDFELQGPKVFFAISHGPKECGFPLSCTSSVLIIYVKGFREDKG